MAITVKHTKVSTIPDGDDSSLIRPSDWNDDHVLTGTISVANGGTGASTLTGYVKGNGTSTMTASTTIPNTDVTGLGTASTKDAGSANGVATLDASGKVPASQIPLQGDLNYQGTWNASTNSPTLTSSVGTKGYYYVVDVSGSTNLNGITDWVVGDWAIFNGSAWQKVDNTDAVTSVNGFTGTVVLTTTNIAEGTNEYYTDTRARNAISAGTGISYVSSTGVITNSAPDQTVSLTAGTGISTSGTYPNFTITNTSPSLGGNVVGPASATDNAIARYDTTTGKLIQNSVVTIDDAGNIENADSLKFSGTPPTVKPIGSLWFDLSNDTLNLQQNNIVQQIGEEIYVYGKASNTITGETLLQVIVKTGAVGASGVIEFGVAGAGITDTGSIIGIATENIATNGFGRITNFGVVHGINTTGSTYGETWADGDDLWYNPVTGGITKTKPSAPNLKTQLGTIIHAGAGGSGSFQVLILEGTVFGGTDSNVGLGALSAAQLITYSTTDGYWKNTSLAAGTGISVGNAASGVVTVTNSAPDQTVAISSGTGISVTGTYPNFTVTNTAPSSGGTVTSVTGTAPVVSSGGATPAISMAAATGSVNGYLTSTDWTTFNSKYGSGSNASLGTLTTSGLVTLSSGSGLSISSTGVTSPAAANGNVFSGTYTPSLTNTTNIGSSTASTNQYTRVGNVVTVSGAVVVDATTAGANTQLRMTLPIATTFGATNQLGGTGASVTAGAYGNSMAIYTGGTTGEAEFRWLPTLATAQTYAFSFTYLVV